MRRCRSLPVVVSLALVVVSCSSDLQQAGSNDGSVASATSTTAASTAAASTTSPSVPTPSSTAAAPSTTAARTTTADVSTSTEAPSTVAPAAISPEALCRDGNGAAYFGYRNDATTPVVVDAADSTLVGTIPDEDPLVPTLFAPGHVSLAFWAVLSDDGDQSAATWTVRGPDGEERAATVDADTPECTEDLLSPSVPDDRAPDLAFTYDVTPGANGKLTTATITAAAIGIGDTSVCADGLSAEAPAIWTSEDVEGGASVAGTTTSVDTPFIEISGPGGGTSLVAQTVFTVVVLDQCSADGTTARSWPLGSGFAQLRQGVLVCLDVADDGTVGMRILDEPSTCGGLPLTDGVRIRSIPST